MQQKPTTIRSMSPRVSIITPLFNREQLVEDTIQSVIRQTYADWEWLMVDDGSTDRSFSVATDLTATDDRISVFHREDDLKGANVCRNEGLSKAAGQYVIFLDSDDLLDDHCLQRRLEITSESSSDFDANVFPMRHFRDQPGDTETCWFVDTPQSEQLTGFLAAPLWGPTCVLWPRETLEELGGFAPELPSWQDWELHVRALIQGVRFNTCDVQPDSFFRLSHGQNISSVSNSLPHLQSRTKLIHEVVSSMIAAEKLTAENKSICLEQFRRIAIQLFLARETEKVAELEASLVASGMADALEAARWKQRAKSSARSIRLKRITKMKPVRSMVRNAYARLAG